MSIKFILYICTSCPVSYHFHINKVSFIYILFLITFFTNKLNEDSYFFKVLTTLRFPYGLSINEKLNSTEKWFDHSSK